MSNSDQIPTYPLTPADPTQPPAYPTGYAPQQPYPAGYAPQPAYGAAPAGPYGQQPGAYGPQPGAYYVPVPVYYQEPDAPSGGFAVLGFFFPIVGLILFLVWNDRTPLRAKSAGKGALISVIVYAGIGILAVIISLIAAAVAVNSG
ncbi:MAG: hypothetical protein FWF36_01025 [Propionibacteriaceae bacterium]|nr:hypothetical protein [Propionibacteriaceae bacterium]